MRPKRFVNVTPAGRGRLAMARGPRAAIPSRRSVEAAAGRRDRGHRRCQRGDGARPPAAAAAGAGPRPVPPTGPTGIADLDHIVLTFAEPVDLDALTKLLSIELRPAPGHVGRRRPVPQCAGFRRFCRLAPGKREAGQSYLVQLKNAVPDGRVAILRLKLSNEPGLDEPSFELRLQSAVPFTVTEAQLRARARTCNARRAAALHAVGD